MQHALKAAFVPLAALALFAILASAVQAQEIDASAEASAEVRVETIAPQEKFGPFQILREKRLELQNKTRLEFAATRKSMMDARLQMSADLKTATSGAERRTVVDEMREKREEARDQQKDARTDLKERLQLLIRTHLGSAVARLNAALRRFDDFTERIESRIEKLKERGVDTASAESLLLDAVTLTASARANVQALVSLIDSVTDTSDPQAVKAEMRAAIVKATESVKEVHQAMLKTARELGALARESANINSKVRVDSDN